MKRILAAALLWFGFVGAALALGPVANYQWDFNLTNSAAGTNLVNSARPGGDAQGAAATTPEALLQMLNTAGGLTNLLGLPGSGVGTNVLDRAVLLPGTMGGNGPVLKTPDNARSITNAGLMTNFTITAWIKADSALSGFPRIYMMGATNQDAGGLNNIAFLLFTGDSLQLKIHGYGANGVSSPTSFLTPGLTDWLFVAVTYDSTIDLANLATNNVYFYAGDRFNPLAAGAAARYGSTTVPPTVNSTAPASTTGVGYVNYDSVALNGDGTPGVSNVFVYIGNRNNQARAFNGRYDDIRLYANRVLTQNELDQVRQDPGLPLPERINIVQQPLNTTIIEGHGAAFSVTANVTAPNKSYQWYRINPGAGVVSNLVVGATNQTYQTGPLSVATDNGAKYAVRVHSTDPFSDFNGVGVYSTYALVTVQPASALVATPGMLKFEYFPNTGNGTSVDTFLANPNSNYTNNAPDLTQYLPTFDTRNVFPDNSHFNYFVRVTGSITPTVTTNYVFYIRAGDQAQFFLSTDGGVSSNLVASDTVSGGQVFVGPESSVSFAGARFSSPQALTAGTSYPITAFLKESSGANFLQVAWKTDTGLQDQPLSDEEIADRLKPIPAGVLSTTALPSGTISISSQPQPVAPSVTANSKVTFSVGVTASLSPNNAITSNGPVVIQWQKNGVNIPGATGTSYTTPYLSTADSGASYRVVASIPGASVSSSVAVVTVAADTSAPTVLSAAGSDSMTSVTVNFSEPVDRLTALNPANYQINGGALAVSGVTWMVDTNLVNNPSYDAVRLATPLQADNATYTVTVTGVKDTTAHTIAGGNSASFHALGLSPGFVKFEYFEAQQYNSLSGQNVLGLVTLSPKFTNNDPDTVIFPTSAEMSPEGNPTVRSSSGGNVNILPPGYGTRLSTIFVAPVTTNYVFYVAANDTGLLWLSTDANPTNKHLIAYRDTACFPGRQWVGSTYGNTSIFPTNLLDGVTIPIPGATSWPVADANGFAVISLTAGQRYYLELDHLENASFESYDAVTYVTAADNATVVAPPTGTPSALTGNVIGWYFPQPQITSFVKNGNNVSINWTNNLNQTNLGALGYPGLGGITAAFPTASLQTATNVSGPYTALTNASPASIPATAPAQFFRIGE